jgi:hypothetical protein
LEECEGILSAEPKKISSCVCGLHNVATPGGRNRKFGQR